MMCTPCNIFSTRTSKYTPKESINSIRSLPVPPKGPEELREADISELDLPNKDDLPGKGPRESTSSKQSNTKSRKGSKRSSNPITVSTPASLGREEDKPKEDEKPKKMSEEFEPPPPKEYEYYQIGINVFPTKPPPPPPADVIPAKLLAIMKKYPPNWRLNQLAKPRCLFKKFVPVPADYVRPNKVPPKLTREKKFYAENLAGPALRLLTYNKRTYGHLKKETLKKRPRLRTTLDKYINKTWGTIYYHYKRQARDRKLRQLRQQKQKKGKGKKPKIDQNVIERLAKPTKVPQPPPKKKPSKIFSNYHRMEEMAIPKKDLVPPPKEFVDKVNPAALTYEITENIQNLAKLPERWKHIVPPLEPGKVKKSALLYKATPRVEVLARPQQKSDKSKEEEDFNPWAISKNALKYKPSQRIIELSKPVEKD